MRELKRKRQRNRMLKKAAIYGTAAILVIAVAIGIFAIVKKNGSINTGGSAAGTEIEQENETQKAQRLEEERKNLLAEADRLADSYDYDAAIAMVQSFEGYEEYTDMTEKISEYEATKASCVPVNIDEVTHIFYHSLVVDPERCFGNQENDRQCIGNNQWMTTISEFNKITQEMYDRGYVMVSIHDLYNITTDANGNQIFEPATIMLPEGKKAFVLSLDDLSYYHSYDNYGYAAKLIVDENGDVVNEYIDAEGNTLIGAYDVVPLMDKFIEEHPDASYRGAKGIIALTGYNGILGYRTDISYTQLDSDLDHDKRQWIEDHPEFDLETERAEAKKVVEAMKANGWEFASHTWGHLSVGNISLSRLQADTKRWKENVEPLVGPTNTIIFAHGQDLGNWGNYDDGNAKVQYLKEQGFSVFCNVDSNQYRTWFGTDYMRQGRRNLDGYRIYYNAIGVQNNVSDLFDAAEILDPDRPPVLPLT